jgi:hypothetical protein
VIGSVSLLLLIGLAGLVVFGGGYALLKSILDQRRASNFPHPSELSSESRSVIRPLRESADSFESVLKANPDFDAAKIIGGEANEAVKKTLAESMRAMPYRDQLVKMARRLEQQRLDASAPLDAVDRIDRNIAEATQAIDELTLKVSQAATQRSEPALEFETDLPALISRLQNVGRSFDEVNQNLSQNNEL